MLTLFQIAYLVSKTLETLDSKEYWSLIDKIVIYERTFTDTQTDEYTSGVRAATEAG